MRTVTYGAACTLDGFIASSDGAVDWILNSQDANKVMAEYWPTIDTMVMGRKTWDFAAGSGESGGAWGGTIRTYVCSRTLANVKAPDVTVVRDGGALIRELKTQPGKGICIMSGGSLAGSLLEAGVIDEIGLNVHPVLLGSGVPLFVNPGRRVPLELLEVRGMARGCVYMRYRVSGDAPARPRKKRAT